MSIERAFDHVPPKVTEFQYEDSFIRIKKRSEERIEVFAKNVNSDYKLHLFMKDNELHGVVTKEPTATTVKDHGKPFLMKDILRAFSEPVEELLSSVETVSRFDRRFSGKSVQMASFHEFRFGRTRKNRSYIEPDLEFRDYKFESIDLDLPQIGVMKGWFGREVALVFVGRGEVHILRMKHIKKYARRLETELMKVGFDKLYPD